MCCHLACERLGKRLGLEVSVVGVDAAPCGRGVYSRLKGFLGSALRTPGKGEGTLGKRVEKEVVEVETLTARRGRKRKIWSGGDDGNEAADAPLAVHMQQAAAATGKGVFASKKAELEAENAVSADVQQGRNDNKATEQRDNQPPDHEDNAVRLGTKQQAKTPLRRGEKHAQRPLLSSRQVRKDDIGDGDEDDDDIAGLRPGLGTMFQPAVDWLGAGRRREFAAWKVQILKDIRVMEGVVEA